TAGEKPAGVIKSDLKRGDCYPLAEFFAIPVLLSDPKGNGHRNYAHAGALLDFMINTKLPPVAGRFGEFLAAARQGRGFGRAASATASPPSARAVTPVAHGSVPVPDRVECRPA